MFDRYRLWRENPLAVIEEDARNTAARDAQERLLPPLKKFSKSDVRTTRTRNGFSQAQFAEQIGVTTATVKNWEAGRKSPDVKASRQLNQLRENPLPSEAVYRADYEERLEHLNAQLRKRGQPEYPLPWSPKTD